VQVVVVYLADLLLKLIHVLECGLLLLQLFDVVGIGCVFGFLVCAVESVQGVSRQYEKNEEEEEGKEQERTFELFFKFAQNLFGTLGAQWMVHTRLRHRAQRQEDVSTNVVKGHSLVRGVAG
jgi:Na+-transporting methylmalonyl-CoA/oxaloacetate decarboxylase gamma subunit